ncbi:MAG: radical SAM protein [Nitrospirae bacterium]|nr:MAG: radical SAM protein [Nitrospirota bacterium]
MTSRKLIKKADQLLEKEKGTVFKDPGGKVNVCLVYPNTYRVGMSSLGFQGIYSILNSRNDTVCERAFLPDEEDMEEHLRTGTPLFSLESKRPLNRFDIVAFSVSYENDYPAIPKILHMGGIPPVSAERNHNHPLTLLGGVCAGFNPEPLSEFFDIIFVGEAETSIHSFIERFKNCKERNDFLYDIVSLKGFYVPAFYEIRYSPDGTIMERIPSNGAPEVVERVTEEVLDFRIKPAIITPEAEFSDMYLLEAMRGCPWSCRFCLAGHIYNPPRQKNRETLIQEIKNAQAITERVGLIGPSLTDYRYIEDALSMEGVEFSITSLRASRRSAGILSLIQKKQSISIAPEAGTERLRRIINKKITEEDIIETAGEIFKTGINRLRLYFMIGLPFEEDSDIEGLIELTKKIRSLSTKGLITLSVSTFVPKPFTPFQWHPMATEETVKKRIKMLRKELNQKGIRVFHDVPKYAYLQGILARGDRRLSRFLVDLKDAGNWRKTLKKSGLSEDFYIFRKREFSEILPWDFIDTGISREQLWNEYKKCI